MGLTLAKVRGAENVVGSLRSDMYDITFDSSYASGGESLVAAAVGLKNLLGVQFMGGNAAALGYVPYWDSANDKVVMLRTAATAPTTVSEQISYTGVDVLGADADVAGSDTADQAAGPTNDDRIDTLKPVASGTWAYDENNEIDYPRNVCITVQNTTGGTLSFIDGTTSFLVTGFFRGVAQSETISFVLTGGQEDIVAAKFRWKYGVKPFDSITNVVETGLTAAADAIDIGVGIGRLLGLPETPATPAEADFLKVIKEFVDIPAATFVYNDTNQTMDLGAITAAQSFTLNYLIDRSVPNAAAAAVLGEPVSVDLSSLTIRAQFIGW